MKLKLVLLLTLTAILSSCMDEKQLRETLKENPDIITDAIKANPGLFIETLNSAVKLAQADMAKKREEDEKKQLEDSFNNPLEPQIRKDELVRGTKGAPIVLIEYSDFECPYCARGFQTVTSLLKGYQGKVEFIYKHLPLSFHPNAMPASRYYEAIRIQSGAKAIKFHDELYANQAKIKKGESFFKAVAKKLGLNMSKLAKDVKSEAVQKRIDEDMAEAQKFGFSGTPGFLINGIPVKGAYPKTHFDGIIKKLQEKGKLKL